MAAICGLLGCSGAAPIVGIKVSGPTALLDLFPQARKTTVVSDKLQDHINTRMVSLGGKRERVLFLHPKSEVIFPLRIEQAAVLETAIALLPEAWEKGGDGVTFYVAVRQQDDILPTYLFTQHLYPQSVAEHRGWQPVRLDLTSLRDTDMELILGTDPGPALDGTLDWAVWRDPRIYNPAVEPEELPSPQSR